MCRLTLRRLLLLPVVAALLPAPAVHCQAGDGAVLLIIDGLGAEYIYPGGLPRAADGSTLAPALPWEWGLRVENVTAPVPRTGPGHAVLFTGCSDAEPEQVAYPNCTIFDMARAHGRLCVAVLERGDSAAVLAANDAAVHDAANSVTDPDLRVVARTGAPAWVVWLLEDGRDVIAAGLRGLEGAPRYAAYNRWALGCAGEIVSAMSSNGTDFLLTVNLGGADSAGHYLGYWGYIQVVDALRDDLGQLRETCARLGVVLVVTSDHGMAFPDDRSRGGHASAPYMGMAESRRIPLFVLAPGADGGLLAGEFGQQDVAPTLLGLMGIERRLPLADGCSVLTGCPAQERGDFGPAAGDASSTRMVLASTLVAVNAAGLGYIYRLYRRR